MQIEPRRIPADHPDALALVQAMVDGLTVLYGPADPARPTPSATPEDFSPPGGAFVVLYEDERAVAGGGVKRLYEDTGEIKRMFVVPDRRGNGLARRLLAELEAAARDLGYARVRLDTGAEQPHAQALYRSAGYTEIPDYNDNSYATYWGEKAL
jgi:GNAT superfamily N-acetyltransferase